MLGRDDVVQLGDVLAGTAQTRESDRDITIFDSTGLTIQDLGIVLAATSARTNAISRRSIFSGPAGKGGAMRASQHAAVARLRASGSCPMNGSVNQRLPPSVAPVHRSPSRARVTH